jgi:hypothetical protein
VTYQLISADAGKPNPLLHYFSRGKSALYGITAIVTYQLISADAGKPNPLLHYFCTKQCNKPASKFLRSLVVLESEMQKLSTKVGEVDIKVKEVGNKVEEIAGRKFTPEMIEAIKEISQGQMTENVAGKAPEEVATMIEATAKDQLAEMKDRVRRKTNILIFGIKESKDKSSEDRKKEDEDEVKKLLTMINTEQKPVEQRRLGGFTKEGEKVRPL